MKTPFKNVKHLDKFMTSDGEIVTYEEYNENLKFPHRHILICSRGFLLYNGKGDEQTDVDKSIVSKIEHEHLTEDQISRITNRLFNQVYYNITDKDNFYTRIGKVQSTSIDEVEVKGFKQGVKSAIEYIINNGLLK